MKGKRYKLVKRALHFYTNNYGFKVPYSVLIDGTFCKSALHFKINIRDQLPKFLDAEIRLCTTNCCIEECKMLGPLLYGSLKVIEQFECIPCGHTNPISASLCLEKLSKKPKEKKMKYFIATQDNNLRIKLRRKVGIPLLYISHNAINMETPSQNSCTTADEKLSQKMKPSKHEHLPLTQSAIDSSKIVKKRKKIKGPNPLSCKKKKKKV